MDNDQLEYELIRLDTKLESAEALIAINKDLLQATEAKMTMISDQVNSICDDLYGSAQQGIPPLQGGYTLPNSSPYMTRTVDTFMSAREYMDYQKTPSELANDLYKAYLRMYPEKAEEWEALYKLNGCSAEKTLLAILDILVNKSSENTEN